jgi:hypothetical protein
LASRTTASAVVWTVAQQRALAANGVMRAELRVGLEDRGADGGDILPYLPDAVPSPDEAPAEGWEVSP